MLHRNVLKWHEGTRRERWLVNTSQKLMVFHNVSAALTKDALSLIPSLSPAAMVLVQCRLTFEQIEVL